MLTRLIILLLVCRVASAATYYIAPYGSNTNNGLATNTPFLTIQKGYDVSVSGDTVSVLEGTYPETPRCEVGATNVIFRSYRGAPFTRSGTNMVPTDPTTWAKPIAFDIRKAGITVDGFAFVNQTKYGEIVRFERFAHAGRMLNCLLTNYQTIGNPSMIAGRIVQGSGNISATNAAHSCIFSNNWITHFGGVPIFLLAGINNMVISNHIEFVQNSSDIFNAWGLSNYFRGNLCRSNWNSVPAIQNHGDWFQTYGNGGRPAARYIFLQGNISHELEIQTTQISEDGNDIGNLYFDFNIFSRMGAVNSGANNMRWINNLFIYVNTNSGNAMSLRNTNDVNGTSIGTIALNNIWLKCGANISDPNYGRYAMYEGLANPTHLVEFHHNYVGRGTNYAPATGPPPPNDVVHWGSWGLENPSVNGGNPLFVDEDNLNFELQSTSPLLGTGTNASAILGYNYDLNGVPMPASWNIGPLATTNSIPPPPPVGPSGSPTLRLRSNRWPL